MTRSRWLGAVGLCALVGAASACEPVPRAAEDAPSAAAESVEDVVEVVIEAVEAGRPGHVVEYIAYEFESVDGLTYPDAVAAVETLLLKHEEISAELIELEVEEGADPRRKRVSATLAFAPEARRADGSLPEAALRYRFDLEFARRGERWQAVSGSYSRL